VPPLSPPHRLAPRAPRKRPVHSRRRAVTPFPWPSAAASDRRRGSVGKHTGGRPAAGGGRSSPLAPGAARAPASRRSLGWLRSGRSFEQRGWAAGAQASYMGQAGRLAARRRRRSTRRWLRRAAPALPRTAARTRQRSSTRTQQAPEQAPRRSRSDRSGAGDERSLSAPEAAPARASRPSGQGRRRGRRRRTACRFHSRQRRRDRGAPRSHALVAGHHRAKRGHGAVRHGGRTPLQRGHERRGGASGDERGAARVRARAVGRQMLKRNRGFRRKVVTAVLQGGHDRRPSAGLEERGAARIHARATTSQPAQRLHCFLHMEP